MSVRTANAYGRITIAEEAIAQVAVNTALECYGIVGVDTKPSSGSLTDSGKRKKALRGVRVRTDGDRIFIDLFVTIKYGVSIEAVAQSLKKSVKYDVERFTGMVVDTVNVNVIGIRI
ncbi:MAG: Asp23/Gls24 family envelope stress response protein [Clostridiales bacterium]|nr:Asp23/Gls24 family envelope stress response protein [Clostridiales bacterium]